MRENLKKNRLAKTDKEWVIKQTKEINKNE